MSLRKKLYKNKRERLLKDLEHELFERQILKGLEGIRSMDLRFMPSVKRLTGSTVININSLHLEASPEVISLLDFVQRVNHAIGQENSK